jgi:hypothetical protein
LRGIVLEVLEQHLLPVEEAGHPLGIAQGQVATQDDTVETGQDAVDLVGVLDEEGMFGCNGGHGVFSEGCWLWLIIPSSLRKTPFPIPFRLWLRRGT